MKQTPRIVLNYVIFAFLFMGASVIIGKTAHDSIVAQTSSVNAEIDEDTHYTFVLDAGHGGEDGGASAGDVLEKDLNLRITENIADLCTVFGVSTRLTRTDDRLLYDYYDDLEDYKGKKKTYDLRNRLKIAEESPPDLFVSIHMNKFTQPQYRGLQVYFSPNTDESEEAAAMVQSYVKKYLTPENERQTKRATQAIYILKKIKTPAILVECGFLSNADELALLQTQQYREKTAAVIFASCMEYSCMKYIVKNPD
ncbi:MAG: N-acetylmuramoyl-L-alanine amidase [Eubacteriales bacterium]